MKVHGVIYFFSALIILFSYTGCKSACEIKNRAEGFDKDKLRIYIRISNADIPVKDRDDNNYLLKEGEKRAYKILESYIMTNVGDPRERETWLTKIPDAVKKAGIVCRECNDEYCEAFIDYDAGALKEIIGK
jgi:hypothetical protein